MQAVLLANGELNKLCQLTTTLPAPMVPLVNRPVMEYLIERLARQKITEILVCVYDNPAVIEAHFGSGSRWGVNLEYILQNSPAGSAGSLLRMVNQLEDTFLVVPADVFNDIDFLALINAHRMSAAAVTVAVGGCSPDTYFPVQVNSLSQVVGIGAEIDQPLYSSGICLLEKSALAYLPSQGSLDLIHDLLPSLLAEGVPVQAFFQNSYWNPLNDYDQYHTGQQAVLSSLLDKPAVDGEETPVNYSFLKAVEVRSGIWLGQNSAIHHSARLIPPVFIGPHCRIGRNVEIGPYVVLGRAVYIDDGATLQDTTVWDHTYIGKLLDLKQRIVSKNILIDPQTGENVRLYDPVLLGEVNTSIVTTGIQRTVDIFLALLAILAALPILILLGVLLTITTRRLLDTSLRVARRSEPISHLPGQPETFSLLRFNTRLPGGTRNRIGSWIERWDLHRLPELFNVLRGELGLVGVMPLTPEQADLAREDWQAARFAYKSGFTGLWYLQAPPDEDLNPILVADAFYTATRSWKRDLYLLWKTPQVWLRRGIQGTLGQE